MLALLVAAVQMILGAQGEGSSAATFRLWGFAFVVLTIMWASSDARERQYHKPFEFGFIAYILWPIVFPWYLVSTRGIRGLWVFLWFVLLWLVPSLIGFMPFGSSN